MTDRQGWRLAAWAGRLLLLGAVAFWWGAIVAPRLIGLAFPALLAPDDIPRWLDPDTEGTVANAVSAAALALVACGAAAVSLRRASGRIATGGWALVAVTTAVLAWEEVAELKAAVVAYAIPKLGSPYFWPVLVSPLIVAFVLAMAMFVRRRLRAPAVRTPFTLGLVAWVLAILHEASYPVLFSGRAEELEIVLEETLEFGGALLMLLSVAAALRGEAAPPPWSRAFHGRRMLRLVVGSMAAVVVLGAVGAFVYRGPLADAQARTHIGTFPVSLQDGQSLVQELDVLPAPIARLDVRVANRDPHGRAGGVIWRIVETGDAGLGPALREGRMEVPAGEHPTWISTELPPLADAERRPLAVQLVADIESAAALRVGATNTNRYEGGRLWINGALTWPGQNIEFVAYGAPEPTWSKARTMWHVLTSDWRWPVLLADLAIALTLSLFIPALLVTAARSKR